VISLRPAGGHDAMRRAAARRGAGLVALSPWRIVARDDDDTRCALRGALSAPIAVFTSPAAVRAAATLSPLSTFRGAALGVGGGTAAALRRAGAVDVSAPARMDSDGVLSMPALASIEGRDVALVTAPGGRDRIAPALRARGARVRRVDVYAREAVPLAARQVARLRALDAPAVLAVSSGQALARVLDALPADAARALRRCAVAVASDRLADQARGHGFRADAIGVADGPRPAQLAATAAGLAARR
jgi:uroporphyrinogen-III synthase